MIFSLSEESDLDAASFIDVLNDSGLGARRPVNDVARIETMLRNADLIVTARDDSQRLIGVSRCVTDFAYCCYCSDLAVRRDQQHQGVGQALIAESRRLAGNQAAFILVAAPYAVAYYPKIGAQRIEHGFLWPRER
ncbi:MAG: GNAT family N-acetyltransferase [Polyangiales bacterium]